MQTIYMVWIRMDDFYDDGHVVAAHRTRQGAEADADSRLGSQTEGVGTVTEVSVEEWKLQ